jgi:hypothetical protein
MTPEQHFRHQLARYWRGEFTRFSRAQRMSKQERQRANERHDRKYGGNPWLRVCKLLQESEDLAQIYEEATRLDTQ